MGAMVFQKRAPDRLCRTRQEFPPGGWISVPIAKWPLVAVIAFIPLLLQRLQCQGLIPKEDRYNSPSETQGVMAKDRAERM